MEQIVGATTEKEFVSSDLHFYAVAQLLTVVGEAASRLSGKTKEKYSHIEWRTIIGLRNVLIHQYFGVDRPMVWEVATNDARILRGHIAAMTASDFIE